MSSKRFLPLFCSIFFLFAGYSLFLNSAGVRLTQAGVSTTAIGALNAAFFCGATLSAVMAHRIVSRVGHIRSFGIFGAVFAMAALAHMMTENLWSWAFLRLVLGFCYFSLVMVVESWFTARSPAKKRAKVLAIYQIVFYIALAAGVGLLSLQLTGDNVLTLSAIMVMAAMIPIGLTKTGEPEIPPRQRISVPRIFVIVPLAWVGSFLSGLMVNGFFTMASVFILKQGFGVAQVSQYLWCAMAGGFIAQVPMASLSNKFGRRTAICWASALLCVATVAAPVLMYFLPGRIWVHDAAAFVAGCGLFTLYALSLARANDVLPNDMSTVEVNRSLLFVYGLGSLIAPLLIGALMEFGSGYGFYLIYAVCSLFLAVFAARQKPVPEEERSVYVPVPGAASPVITALDPRNDAGTDAPFDVEKAEEYVRNFEQDSSAVAQDEVKSEPEDGSKK